jgi:hypothetical protein
MNLKQILAAVLIIPSLTANSWAKALTQTAGWPLGPPMPYLKGGVNALASGGGLVFWAVGDTVTVIDRDLFSKVGTFRVSTGSEIQDMLYDSGTFTLYIAAGFGNSGQNSGGLQIFSLSDPANPVLVSALYRSDSYPGSSASTEPVHEIDARGLGFYENTLFLADNNYGLRVIDVRDSGNPVEIPRAEPDENFGTGYEQPNVNGSYEITGGYVGISVHPYHGKTYAFVRDYYHGVDLFDVTDPARIGDPVVKNTLSPILTGSVSLLSDIFVTESGGRLSAFVDGGNSGGTEFIVSRLDVSVEDGIAITNYGYGTLPGDARGLWVDGSYAYVADGSSGLRIVDISSVPSNDSEVVEYPVVGSFTENADFSYSVLLDGATLYLACCGTGLIRLDVSDPASPAFTDSIDPPLFADDVCVSGDYTYMLDRTHGFRIFNTSIPGYPVLEGFLALSSKATDLCVSGTYAFLSDSAGTVKVIDVSDPVHPVFTGASIPAESPAALFASGNRLYIADTVTGLSIADITDPLAPFIMGIVATYGTVLSVTASDGRAYVSEGASGVEIFDVSNPAAPISIARIPMNDARCSAATSNGSSCYLIVADGTSGLAIQNVTDLSSPLPDPVFFNRLDDPDKPASFTAATVAISGSYAFVGLGEDGILALDITHPEQPSITGHCSSPSYSSDIALKALYDETTEARTVYATVSGGSSGIGIFYVNDNSSGEDSPLVPDLDTGCFIASSFGKHD